MKRNRLPVSSELLLEKIVSYGKKAPENIENFEISALIRLLRHALRMTQAQLARRAGLPQSHVAVIEMGKVDLKVKTLRKIFNALGGGLLVVPRFPKTPSAIVAERIAMAARKKVARVAGTMALEKQIPETAMIDRLIRAEEERMLREPSSEIWEE
ncbi:MAG: helix-turn-helix domain-containing protein [Elusimicrobia bacterium]|nr:helix-turn-helix domain-containing protein [Elusimicrobiota bacterium]